MRQGIWGLLLVATSACGLFEPSQPDWKPSEAMDRSARMLRQLDRLESDLHNSGTENVVYAELVERHGQAQQMACSVTDEHVQEIHRLALAQQKKREEKAAKRRHLAMARAPKRGKPAKAAPRKALASRS